MLVIQGKRKNKFSFIKLYENYLLTLFPAEVVAMKKWKSKTRDYHQKLNGRVAALIAKRLFKT